MTQHCICLWSTVSTSTLSSLMLLSCEKIWSFSPLIRLYEFPSGVQLMLTISTGNSRL